MAVAAGKFTKKTNIGELLQAEPRAMAILEKYFGKGCFTCPGMKMETIAFGAMMHNVDPEKMVAELNALSQNG